MARDSNTVYTGITPSLLMSTLAVLAVCLSLTAIALQLTRQNIRDVAADRLTQKLDRLEDAVRAQFRPINDGIHGLMGLYAANGRMQRKPFDAWIASHDMRAQYPGVRSFGWIERIERSQRDRFLAAVRSEGAADFAIETTSTSSSLYVVKYLAPQFLTQPVMGLDVGSEHFSREAIEQAVDFGDPVLTRSTTSDQGNLWGSDFLYLVPFYRSAEPPLSAEDRRKSLTAVVFAPIALQELLQETRYSVEDMLDYEVFDGSTVQASALAYSSQQSLGMYRGAVEPADFQKRLFQVERKLLVDGRLLLLRAASSASFESSVDSTTPRLVATAGVVLSLLLTLVYWLLVTGRLRAQNLARSMTRDLERMAHVVRNTTHIVVVGDVNRNISWVNEAFTKLTGLTLPQVQGKNFVDVLEIGQTDVQRRGQLHGIFNESPTWRMQLPWNDAHGVQHWFDVDLQSENDADGAFAGYIAIAADVTAQHNAATQIAAAMRENKQLMDAIDRHSIVSISDCQGIITYANSMFSEVSGYSREELLGQYHSIIKSDVQPDVFWSAMWKTISSGKTWRATVCNKAKSGALYWVDTVISPFFDEAGNIEKYVSIRTDITASKAAQVALAYEREHLNAIIQGTNAGTWEWEVPTDKLIINSRWAEMMGYSKDELEPSMQAMRRLAHPEEFDAATQRLRKLFSSEQDSIEFELRMRHRDGHWVWVQTRGKVSKRDANGRPVWISGIHLDVSEQRNLQDQLAEKNKVMQSVLDNIPVALSVFNKGLQLVAKNDKFAELLNFPSSLFEGTVTTFESIIQFNAARGEYGDGDVHQAVEAIIERARHTVHHQFERVRPDGTALEVRGAPMPGGGFVTTYADISERKRSEAEIARTTNLLQSVLDAASEVAVIATGTDRKLTVFNRGAERMLGYRAEEVLGIVSPEIFHDPTEVQARCSALSAQIGGAVAGFEIFVHESNLGKKSEWTYVRKNGEHFAVALVITALTDAAGNRTGYLGLAHDITQEKIHEQSLRAAMEEAEQAALAKGQFLANMSHEIRTPMNAILGMLKLLQNTALDPRQLDYTTKTEGAARSLLSLLNDILDFSKMDAGKMQLDPQPFHMEDLLHNLSVILAANIGNKQIEVLFDIDPQLPDTLIGDSLRLQQILINLGGNAIKFTEHGEVVFTVALKQRVGDLATVYVGVRDSGIGIAPEHQQHIFSGFSQAEASTTRRFGGTGLGLSICRRLVELMGSELLLHSVVGQGSTFHFTIDLPIAHDTVNASGSAHHRCSVATKPWSVLMVDDNAIARQVIGNMGKSLGWEVTTVDGGEEALDCITSRASEGLPPYHAIFMDWRMPGMDGWETTRRIRQEDAGSTAPIVIMVTANDRDMLSRRDPQERRELDGFLVKPITAAMLRDAVLTALSGHQDPSLTTHQSTGKIKRLQGMRLLVVEDNLINQQVAKELLCAEGALVDLANNGQLGVEAVAKADPGYDAVLMDIQMPVMDGYTAAVTIRHELGQRALPIIAMTANAMASDREACLAAGMNDHIGKPFDLPQLVELLQRHTGQYPGPAKLSAVEQDIGASSTAHAIATDATALVDVAGALARFEGNTGLYLNIVQAYLTEVTAFPDLLDNLLQAGNLIEARRAMHTIKGLSRTVGAEQLAQITSAAEDQLGTHTEPSGQAPPPALLALMANVRTVVAQTMNALQNIHRQMHVGNPETEAAHCLSARMDIHRLREDLNQLEVLLSQSDLRALELHAEMQQRLGSVPPEGFETLSSAVSAFDFTQAVVQCKALIKKYCSNDLS